MNATYPWTPWVATPAWILLPDVPTCSISSPSESANTHHCPGMPSMLSSNPTNNGALSLLRTMVPKMPSNERDESIRSITSSLPGQVDRLRSIVNDLRVCHFDLCANYTPLLHRWIHVSRTVRQVLDLLVEASSTLTNEGHPPALTNVTQVIDILRTSIQANSVYSDWPQQSLITSPLSLMGRMTPPSLSLHPMIQSHFDQDVLNTAPPTAPNYTSREVLHPNKSVHDYPDRPFPLVDGIPLTSSGAVGGFAFFAHECQRPLNPTFTSILVGKQPKWYMSVDRYSSPCSTEKAKPWMSGPARSMSSQMDSQARYSTLLLKRFVSATCLSDIRP
ncbi:hypothetical protein CC2G_000217 [Coprinopsis cinerea AmutBmut pab1-1]|nr:hypothetical protein CC2G_000217 [Coprinopsis cinerea AmutBmut pab1-1]